MRVVVTGGTGRVGGRLVDRLAARGADVVALTRDPEGKPSLPQGATYVEGDLADRESLASAFDGADAVYLLTPLVREEAELGRNAVGAAVDAGVGRVVFQSVQHAEQAKHIPHFGTKVEIAEELERTGLPWTVLEPNSFFQNDLDIRPLLTGPGVYAMPLGPVGVSRVDCDDIAEAAATCLLDEGHAGRTYAVAGPDAFTGEEVAAIWSAALGRPIRYGGDDLEAWAGQMRQVLPGWLVEDLVIMWRYFIEHGLAATPEEVATVTKLLDRPPRSFESWATEVAVGWA